MVNFLLTTLFGICFSFCVALLTIGFMFVVRVLVILWFDVDFMEKLRNWFSGS